VLYTLFQILDKLLQFKTAATQKQLWSQIAWKLWTL